MYSHSYMYMYFYSSEGVVAYEALREAEPKLRFRHSVTKHAFDVYLALNYAPTVH